MVVREIAEEFLNDFLLFFGEVRHVIELMDVTEVGKELPGRSHVLVHIIEVGYQQLSPAVKVVECLFDACTLDERLVKIAYQFDGVTHLQSSVLTEEVADGDIGGAPQRMRNQARQLIVEKQRGISSYKCPPNINV